MPINKLEEILYLGNTYQLFDDTVNKPVKHKRKIYHFVNKGTLLSLGTGRFVDDHCVREALVSAESPIKAIELFVREYHIQHDSLITIELIGDDNRDLDADPYLMHSIRKP